MKKKKVILLLALLCAVAQGAWADNQPWTDFAVEPEWNNDQSRPVYYIRSAENLAWLAKKINNEGNLNGENDYWVEQKEDIDLSAHEWVPIGTNTNHFYGNYDGCGHTIRGLKCHRGNDDYVGLFGYFGRGIKPNDMLSLQGSLSNITLLESEVEGRNQVGGICGITRGANINHCITDAKVSGKSCVGGIIGEERVVIDRGIIFDIHGYTVVQQCLYMGSSVTATEKRGAIVGLVNKYDDNGHEDFALAYEGKLHDNYFTHPSMTALNGYDVRGYSFRNWSPDIITTKFTDDTKSKVVEYNGLSYIPKTGMKMTVEMAEGIAGDYILTLMLNGRTITASDGTYSIDLADDEIAAIVSAKVEVRSLSGNGTETDPYVIASIPEWNFMAAKVKDGNTYKNKYLRLDADITVSQMVGTSENPFEGCFDGNNHTLTFNVGTENAPFDEDYCAPFRYYHSTSIKNLTVKGDIYTKARYAGGIVGQLQGLDALSHSAEITDCRSSISIHSSYSGAAYNGGFVAEKISKEYGTEKYVNFTRCVFDGKLLGANNTDCGGFLGKDDGRAQCISDIKDCLLVPQEVTLTGNYYFTYNNTGCWYPVTITNGYFQNWNGSTTLGKQGYVYEDALAAFGEERASNKFMTAYNKAIKFDGKYYTGIVPMADDADNSDLLGSLNGKTEDVCFFGRTLQAGSYTTFAAPFDISSEQLTKLGITAKQMTDASVADGVLTLNFADVSEIKAGKPYLVKAAAAVENPTFEGVTVSSTTNTITGPAGVDFIPVLGATTLKGDVKTILFIGEGNKLCHPGAENQQMKGFRAYFKLAKWLVYENIGDGNGDGSISINDVMGLVRIVLGEEEIDNATKEKYDINGDGSISVSDVMALVNIVLNGGNGIKNIMVNGADGITFDGAGSVPATAGENYLWEGQDGDSGSN